MLRAGFGWFRAVKGRAMHAAATAPRTPSVVLGLGGRLADASFGWLARAGVRGLWLAVAGVAFLGPMLVLRVLDQRPPTLEFEAAAGAAGGESRGLLRPTANPRAPLTPAASQSAPLWLYFLK